MAGAFVDPSLPVNYVTVRHPGPRATTTLARHVPPSRRTPTTARTEEEAGPRHRSGCKGRRLREPNRHERRLNAAVEDPVAPTAALRSLPGDGTDSRELLDAPGSTACSTGEGGIARSSVEMRRRIADSDRAACAGIDAPEARPHTLPNRRVLRRRSGRESQRLTGYLDAVTNGTGKSFRPSLTTLRDAGPHETGIAFRTVGLLHFDGPGRRLSLQSTHGRPHESTWTLKGDRL